ncbi:MAG: serine/threonine-protein kinase [Burkholderiales bacterium]
MPPSQPSERDRAALQFEPQVQLGKYPILREIGRGATSHVYLARDPFADREVAIKVFMFDQNADPQTERMMHKAFLAEASLAGKLNHPHIVDILDAVAEPDHSYLVMEYVAGTALDAHDDVSTLLPLDKVVEIIFKCIRALEYAFQHGVIHRDIKPGNILLSSAGETKVSDFGASFQQRPGQETTQISGIGSPAYMSPEQIRMEQLTHQTDIYSLGVTMYRLLTGRLPYQATTQAALTNAILNTAPMRPGMLRPELPPLLDKIVMSAIHKEPTERYRSWLEFGKELSQAFTTLRLVGDTLSDSAKFNELRQLPFFEGFGDVALWEVVRIGAWKKIPGGDVIIREGDQGESFYLLIAGAVSVTLSGKQLNTVKPGGCFGEILYFTENVQRRTTTITALGDVTVIEIKAEALRAATDACQVSLNKAFMRVLIERLMQANMQLAARG